MELDRDALRLRYRLCGLGFLLSGLAIALLCLDSALNLILFFTGEMWLFRILDHTLWSWAVGAPITTGALIGSYLLWGRWTDAHWQRRAGLLLLLNLLDFSAWMLYQGDLIGLRIGHLQDHHSWFLRNMTEAFGWVEFLLFASLASEVASHLGMSGASDAGRATRTSSSIGLALWAVFFVTNTSWAAGWPLVQGVFNPMAALLILGSFFLRTVASGQVAALCFVAARSCQRTRRELIREEQEHDPLLSRSERAEDFQLHQGGHDDPFRW